MPRQTTPPADYPQAVLQQIEQLAQNIVIARKRRGESQAQWAKKLGISQPTMARIERGDPSVAMASYVMCMWLINQAGGLADLIAPQHDYTRALLASRPQPLPPVAAGDAPPVLAAHGLSVTFRRRQGWFGHHDTRAVREVSARLLPGRTLVLVTRQCCAPDRAG